MREKYESLSVSVLRELAKSRGIKGTSGMKKANLVTSTRGAQGGYRLARPAREISVGDVLRALEGDLRAVACPAEDAGEEGCANSSSCVTRYVWQRVNESIRQAVDTIWISQLASQGKALEEQSNQERTCERVVSSNL